MNATQVRQQLDALLASIEEREAAIAQALEDMTVDGAMRAAWEQSARAERQRIVLLIDNQLQQLDKGGLNAISLHHLREVLTND
jgi:VIT1/CCC1 family predicted Fe2+/Mn2+ transporter